MKLPVNPPVSPMLAKLTRDLPREKGLYYEPKWDGFRCIVFRDGDDVELGSRNEKPLTRYFPELVDALRRELPDRCVLDGEIVIAGPKGLDFDDTSHMATPYAQRRTVLEKLLKKAKPPVHLTPATTDPDVAADWFSRF